MTTRPRPLVLMFHRVHDALVDPWGLCVSPANFADQLDALTSQRTVLPLSALTARARAIPPEAVVLTFDDGYVDNVTQALPVLHQHEAPATLFVATAHIDRSEEFWWDRLETLLLSIGTLPDSLSLQFPDGPRHWELGEAADLSQEERDLQRGLSPSLAPVGSRLRLFHELYIALWPLSAPVRDELLEALGAWSGMELTRESGRRTVTSGEIKHLADSGVFTIGGHTVDHPALTSHSLAEQRYQVSAGKLRLEAILEREVEQFAYPHGLFDEDTVNVVAEAGFTAAVTTQTRPIADAAEPLRLPRYSVPNVSGTELLATLDGWATTSA